MYVISLSMPLPLSVLLTTFELKDTLWLNSNLPYIVLPLREQKFRPEGELLHTGQHLLVISKIIVLTILLTN